MKVFYLLGSFCLGLFWSSLNGQQLSIKHYTVKDGLSQNETRNLWIDQRGHLWIMTYNTGVIRFDGQNMQIYDKKRGLSNNYVTGIAQDKDQNIWISTKNGLNCFNGQTFESFLSNDTVYAEIEGLLADSLGQIWFVHKTKGLGVIRAKEIQFIGKLKEGFTQFLSIGLDLQQNIWIATVYNGIFIYNPAKKQFSNLKYAQLPFNKLYNLERKQAKSLLLATDRGLFTLKEGRFSQQQYPLTRNKRTYNTLIDSKNGLWVSSLSDIYHFEQQGETFLYGAANGLSNKIYDMIEDREGGIWFSSDEGLFRLNNQVFNIYNNIPDITHIGKSAEAIWFCTQTGLLTLNRAEQFKKIDYEPLNSFPGPLVTHPKRSQIYIFGESGALYTSSGANRFQKVKSFKGQKPQVALMNEAGQLFLGGGFGLIRFEKGLSDTLLTSEDLNYSGLNAIILDKRNILWLATEGNGLLKYAAGQVQKIDIENNLPNKAVTTVLDDSQGNIWFGTQGNGFFKIHAEDIDNPALKVTGFEEYDLASSNIIGLNEDPEGNIWVTTQLDISKIISLENDVIRIESYGYEEGLPQFQIYPNTISKGFKQDLWIGTTKSLININTKDKVYSSIAPDIYINKVKLFFEEVNWNQFAETVERWTGLPQNLSLNYKKNHLAFDFVGVSFNIPEKMQYQWRLQGLEEEWTPLSKRSEAIYPNLADGEYTFLVKACNGGNICSEVASFRFEIAPPPHKTPYAAVLVILVIGASIYLFIKRQIKNLKVSQTALELRVKERTREIESKKAEIEYQSQELARAFKEIDDRNQALTNINAEVSRSIDFASKIQKAFFISEDDLKKTLPDSFLISIPRSVVTSDFFWLQRHKNYLYLCLADCTGTGVSGAFLALIGHACLSDGVRENVGLDPASLLQIINKAMLDILEGRDVEINTAMDLALCRIDLERKELVFAGAKRPLVYVKDNKLQVIRGSFFSTGIRYSKMESSFKNHTIDLKEKVQIYLFSDGFPNQVGGTNKTKYKMSNFKKLLLEVSQQDIEKQGNEIRKSFHSWLAGNAQLDDVSVGGFDLSNLVEHYSNDNLSDS